MLVLCQTCNVVSKFFQYDWTTAFIEGLDIQWHHGLRYGHSVQLEVTHSAGYSFKVDHEKTRSDTRISNSYFKLFSESGLRRMPNLKIMSLLRAVWLLFRVRFHMSLYLSCVELMSP